jgi:hypothetical protein
MTTAQGSWSTRGAALLLLRSLCHVATDVCGNGQWT